MMKQTVSDRFLAKIVAYPHGCHIWQAYTDTDGYGRFKVNGRMVNSHRFAYELFVGPIPAGLQIDHLCRVRNCVNVKHLEVVTQAENIRRGDAGKASGARERAKMHCPAGHPYAGENLYVRPDGRRKCRACQRDHDRAYYARKRAQGTAK